jgi:tetratricopeptide (TPR) repeat protein
MGTAAFLTGVLVAGACPAAVSPQLAFAAAASSSDEVAQAVEREGRIERAMAKTGDLDMILKELLNVRPRVQHWISDQDPLPVSKINAELDRILDPEALRQDIAMHVASSLGSEDVAQVEAWASQPQMAAINAVLTDLQGAQSRGAYTQPSPERLAKLARILRAAHLPQRLEKPASGMELLSQDFSRATRPGFEVERFDHLPQPLEPEIEYESLALSFLVGPLAEHSDAEIDQFLAFAESKAGQNYYQALSSGLALGFGRWRQEFLAAAQSVFTETPRTSFPPNYLEDMVDRELRIEPALARSGDLAMIMSVMDEVRPQVESWIQAMNPEAVSRMGPELDRILAPEALRQGVAIKIGGNFIGGGLEAVETWSSKPQMVAINAVLINPFEAATSASVSPPSPELRDKLLRITRATDVAQRLLYPRMGMYSLAVEVATKIDPDFVPGPFPFQNPTSSDNEALVDRFLAPALGHFPEAEIDEYLAFAESEAGNTYFRSVSVAMGLTFAPWRQELLASVEANAKKAPAQEESNFEELTAHAKQLISIGALSDARSTLLRAERLRPQDSEVQSLLGEVATHLRDGPRPSRGQLRTEPFPEFFAEAERYLARAIELDPSNGRAHVLLARAKFLQSKDSEAGALLAQAKRIDPELAWLRVNQADLASVQGRYNEAIALYQEVLQRPEREPRVHYWALVRSRVAFRDSDRLQDYTALGRKYMQEHPEDKDYPLVFAEHLLYSGEDDAEALQILEKTDPRRSHQLRQQLLAKALAGLAHASRERSGDFNAQSRLWLQRAVELSGGSEATLVRDLAIEPRRLEPMLTVIHSSKSSPSLATEALYFAMFPRRMDVIKDLAKAGADLNAPLGALAMPPLASAALSRDLDLFRLLLELGADPARARIEGKPLEEWMRSFSRDEVVAEMSKMLRSR